jgi:hypothetical protein
VSASTTRPSRRAAGALGGDLFFYALMWSGVGIALLTVNLVANGVWGHVQGSAWDGSASLFQYAMLGAGIMVAASYLPVYVSHGLTRRDFATAALVALVGLAAGAALATTIGYGIEHVVFQVADWPHVLDSERDLHIYDRPDQYGLIAVELFGLYVTHALGGLLIMAALFRLGWLFGALVALVGIAVAVGAEMALAAGFAGAVLAEWLDVSAPPTGVGVAIAAALAVLAAVLARVLLAGVTIETKDAALWR